MRLAGIVCVALAGAAAVGVVAAASPTSHLRMSSSQAEIDDESVAAVRLPFEVDEGWRVVQVDVIDAALGGRRDKDVLEAFSKVSAVDGAAIDLFIQRNGLKWPGTYQVILRFTLQEVPPPAPAAGSGAGSSAGSNTGSGTGSSGAAAEPPQRVEERTTITIVKLAPKLSEPPAVTIQMTTAIHDFVEHTPVLLDETTNRGRLTGVSVTQRGVTLHDSAPASVRVTVAVAPDTVDPGGQRQLIPELVGTPPWGTSSGVLEVNAHQLDKPLTIAFTIEHRRWTGLIALLFAVGGIFGYVIRTWAKRVTDRLALQQRGDRQLAILRPLAARSLRVETKRIETVIAAITTAAAREDDDALTAAIELACKLVPEIVELHTRQLECQRALLARYAAVPELALASQIGVEQAGYADAIAAIEDAVVERDVARAERGLTTLALRLGGRRDALTGWIERLTSALDAMASAGATAPMGIKGRWSTVTSEPLRTAARKPLMLEICELAEPVVAKLDNDLFESRHELARLCNDAKAKLSNAPQLALELATAATTLGTGDLPACVAQLAAVLTAWSDILKRAIAPKLSSREPEIAATAASAMTALTTGDYGLAFDKLNDLMQKAQGGADVVVPTVAEPVKAERAAAALPVIGELRAADDVVLESDALVRTSRWLGALKIAVAYFVLPFGAWVAYHESFIGRLPELIAIAATGFITDFTAESALAKLESLKK